MKRIKYTTKTVYTSKEGNEHTEYNECMADLSDETIAIALRDSYNGEYTIEDDGQPESAPTQLDRIESQVTYTAMMTDTLIMES